MIDKALSFISNQLNQEIKMTYGLTEDMVIAGSLINPDGSVTDNMENKIVLSLINLEHETTTKSLGNYIENNDHDFAAVAPPVYLNLYLLVSANYNSANYLEALKMLSTVIAIFQGTPVFEKSNFPDMDPSVQRLTFEIYNLPINELSHIWSGIGAKYVPSIIYKVRMITIQKNLIGASVPGVTSLGGQGKPLK